MRINISNTEINAAQRELLDSFISSDGIYFEIIRDFKVCPLGYKVLYLEKAITEDCQVFLLSLDKLYRCLFSIAGFKGVPHEAVIEVIRAFKLINDLYFDNEVKYGNFGTKKALIHYFQSLGAVSVDGFQEIIKHIINERISNLSVGHEEEVAKAKSEGIPLRGHNGWRVKLDLPCVQLSSYPRLFRFGQQTVIEDWLRNSNMTSAIVELITSGQVTIDDVMKFTAHQRIAINDLGLRKIMTDHGRTLADILALTPNEVENLGRNKIRELITNGQVTLDEALVFTKMQQTRICDRGVTKDEEEKNLERNPYYFKK